MGMSVIERKKMESSACSSRNEWSSTLLPTVCHGKFDDDLVDKIPTIIPCYNGKSLQIHEELVLNGLSAISIRHPKGNCSESLSDSIPDGQSLKKSENKLMESKSRTSRGSSRDCVKSVPGTPICLRENMKRRNSFWNMHRPELSKLTWPQNFISSAMLQDFFHYHLKTHGTFCEPLHVEANRSLVLDEEINEYTLLRELLPPTVLPPDENAVKIMEKSRSVQLNDEDLDPEIVVHKSRAEFCVTIGEYIRKSFLKRSTSHQIPKSGVHQACRFESLPSRRESFLSKEEINADELVSSIVSNPTVFFPVPNGETAFRKMMTSNNGGISTDELVNSSSSHVTLRTNKIQNGGDFATDRTDKC